MVVFKLNDKHKLVQMYIQKDRVEHMLVDLISTPSPQTDLQEHDPVIAGFIKNAVAPYLASAGVRDISYDSMGNLIAKLGTGECDHKMMLIGNAMTHPPAGMPQPYEGRIVDGKDFGFQGKVVIGRGASEQKATLTSMLSAIEAVVGSGLPIRGTLWFICCTSGETGKHDAIKNVLQECGVTGDMAIICGSSNEISLGNRGRIDVHVTVEGKSCHSSEPHKGANAIVGANVVIEGLSKMKLSQRHPDLGASMLSITSIRSYPDASHTIQGKCQIVIDRRLVPGEDPIEAFDEIKDTIKQLGDIKDPLSGITFTVTTELGAFMYPSLIAADSLVVKTLSRAAEIVLGRRPQLTYSAAAFDQGFLNHMGIQTCNYGPGEYSYAHTDNDLASLDNTVEAARVFAGLILEYLGEDDS